MANIEENPKGGLGKHGIARRLSEDSLREQRAGNQEEADRLMTEAMHTDPEAVTDVLQERETAFGGDAADRDTGDAAVERVSREPTEQDIARAPHRSGVTGSGSGADSERT